MFAGFRSGGSLIVQGGENSGYAWIEGDSLGFYSVYAYDGVVSKGFYYEVVLREFAKAGQGDRGGIRANKNGDATMLVVGSILTGTPDPPPAHADTLQVYYDSGGYGFITVRDSILWPSYDKMFQGVRGELHVSNSFLMSPGEANALRRGLNLGGVYWGGAGKVDHCTVLGAAYPVNRGEGVPTSNSELWKPDVYKDLGGNKILNSRPSPPPVPTHEQLDAIWSP
jgi:hypothetical protein